MEDDVGAGDRGPDRLAVPDVELAEARLPCLQRGVQIRRDAADKGVERDDLARARGDRRVDDVRADVTRAAGDDDASAGQRGQRRSLVVVRTTVSLPKPRSAPPSGPMAAASRACPIA